MKLLTINTHSLLEADYERKCRIFEDAVLKHRPDIIAMQEVNQSISAPPAALPTEFKSDGNSVLKTDNHALKIVRELKEKNLGCYFTWTGIKCGYDRFEEGLAFLSLKPIESVSSFFISRTQSHDNFKTRKALLIKTDDGVFCNTHMGWWDDTEEPFALQWQTLSRHLSQFESIFLMGDFNAPAKNAGEGYDLVLKSGFKDSFMLAKASDDGFTVPGKIDGWESAEQKRLDYIFFKGNADVISSKVIFNGVNEDVISDHFGVITDIERKEENI